MFKSSGEDSRTRVLNRKPKTGGRPDGGYGSAPAPGKAQHGLPAKSKPSGGYGSAGKTAANKPKGGYGTHGKPSSKKSTVTQPMGSYGYDGMPTPKTPIPKDQKTGRFNLPKGKFV